MELPESHPLIRAKRRAGRIKRYLKRKWWERNIGKQYRAWLLQSGQQPVGTVDNHMPITVIVPVFNPPVTFLDECLASVTRQTARNWQLVVSDDGSTEPQFSSSFGTSKNGTRTTIASSSSSERMVESPLPRIVPWSTCTPNTSAGWITTTN